MNALKQQLGPFPLYAWLAGAGVFLVAFVLIVRGRAGKTASTGAGASVQPAVSLPYPIAPQPVGDSGSPPSPLPPFNPPVTQPSPYGSVVAHSIWQTGTNVWVFASPNDGPPIGIVADGTTLRAAGALKQGGPHSANGVTSNYWQPVFWLGLTAYLWGPEASPGGDNAVNTASPIQTPSQQIGPSFGQTINA